MNQTKTKWSGAQLPLYMQEDMVTPTQWQRTCCSDTFKTRKLLIHVVLRIVSLHLCVQRSKYLKWKWNGRAESDEVNAAQHRNKKGQWYKASKEEFLLETSAFHHLAHTEMHIHGQFRQILYNIKYANWFVCCSVPTTCSTPCHPQLNQWDRGQMTVEAFRFGCASLLSP